VTTHRVDIKLGYFRVVGDEVGVFYKAVCQTCTYESHPYETGALAVAAQKSHEYATRWVPIDQMQRACPPGHCVDWDSHDTWCTLVCGCGWSVHNDYAHAALAEAYVHIRNSAGIGLAFDVDLLDITFPAPID
jgi:hypothetical protein